MLISRFFSLALILQLLLVQSLQCHCQSGHGGKVQPHSGAPHIHSCSLLSKGISKGASPQDHPQAELTSPPVFQHECQTFHLSSNLANISSSGTPLPGTWLFVGFPVPPLEAVKLFSCDETMLAEAPSPFGCPLFVKLQVFLI
jgi:hypothetical protein